MEAKKEGVTLSTVEAQTRDYAAKAPKPLQVPLRPLPFLYESGSSSVGEREPPGLHRQHRRGG